MLNIQELKGNAPVTTEQYRELQDAVVITARRNVAMARSLVSPIGPLGIGVQQYSFDKLTEVADAIISYAFTTGSEDIIDLTRSNVKVPILEKKFRIGRRDLASSTRTGIPLDTSTAESCAYKVSYAFTDMILQGWTADGSNYDINGLYQSANNDYSTGKDFGTAGNAITAVAGGMSLLMADNIMPAYNLTLNPVQYAELAGSVHTGGMLEFERVKNMIGGDVFVSPFVTAGTGMLTAHPSQGTLKVAFAQDITTETWQDADTKDTLGRVFMACVPIIYDTNAICKLSSI